MLTRSLSVDFADYLYSRLPSVYRTTDFDKLLYRFLQVFSEGGYNPVLQETMQIMDLLDIDKCPSKFLPRLCAMYGYEYTLELPEIFQRRLLKNIVEMYKRKGTKSVVRFIARELTGYDSEIIENKDFTPYDTEITGWTVEFRNYRNFILRLTAPYGNTNLSVREDVVVKLVHQFIPTNSQVFIITSYWFDEESDIVSKSKDELLVDKVVQAIKPENYDINRITPLKTLSSMLFKSGVETYVALGTTYTDTVKVIPKASEYTIKSSINTLEDIPTYKLVLNGDSEIVSSTNGTTYKNCDIIGEKIEYTHAFTNPIYLSDTSSLLNVSTQLITNTINGYDIIKQPGKPDIVIMN